VTCCWVATAMSQGPSRMPPPPSDRQVNTGTVPGPPGATRPAWNSGLGTPSADRPGMGRSRRSSRRSHDLPWSPGEPATGRRAAVVPRSLGNEKKLETVMPKAAPPNGDAPGVDADPADEPGVGPRRRVSEMQAKLHRWALPEPAHGRNHGEPVAWRHARRVRRAAWGNGPAAMLAPRPKPTHPSAG
jgi:hypothetical protein